MKDRILQALGEQVVALAQLIFFAGVFLALVWLLR